MDGTLIDSLMLWDILWSEFGDRYLNNKNFKPSADDDRKVRTLTLQNAMNLIHTNYKIGKSGEELLMLANSLITDFYANKVELKDGVLEFLNHFKANGVKMCLATATAPDLLSTAIEHLGIGKYFEATFSCATLGKGKDEPDIYLHACEFLQEKPCETWVFEDSLVAIETATKIGMPTVGIYDRYNFGHDKMRNVATEYIANGENLLKLISK